jgi:hypothetical protein
MTVEIAEYVNKQPKKVCVKSSRVVHSDGAVVLIESEFDSYVSCSVPPIKSRQGTPPFVTVWTVGSKKRGSELFFPGYLGFDVFSSSSKDKKIFTTLLSSEIK